MPFKHLGWSAEKGDKLLIYHRTPCVRSCGIWRSVHIFPEVFCGIWRCYSMELVPGCVSYMINWWCFLLHKIMSSELKNSFTPSCRITPWRKLYIGLKAYRLDTPVVSDTHFYLKLTCDTYSLLPSPDPRLMNMWILILHTYNRPGPVVIIIAAKMPRCYQMMSNIFSCW